MSEHGFAQACCIDATHPALPGHFPGQPLVPGVLLLEQVALAMRTWRNLRLTRVLEAKFMAPLLPGQTAMVRLTEPAASVAATGSVTAEATTTRFRFEIQRDGMLLARGVIEGAA